MSSATRPVQSLARPVTFSAAQTRAARGLLDWSAGRLARAAGLEREAIGLFETGNGDLAHEDARRLGATLYAAGVLPIAADLGGEGVRLRRPFRTQARADGRPPAWLPLGPDDGGEL